MKLTWNQEKVLLLIHNGENPFNGCKGMGEYGGRTAVLKSLCKRGLLLSWAVPPLELTEEGTKVASELKVKL